MLSEGDLMGNLKVPFETTVLGETVTVRKVTQTESGIVADCVRDGHPQQQRLQPLPDEICLIAFRRSKPCDPGPGVRDHGDQTFHQAIFVLDLPLPEARSGSPPTGTERVAGKGIRAADARCPALRSG